MPIDTAFYLVSESVAQRSGLIGQRYVTTDGRYVLDTKDLSRIRFTSEEYITGLQGIERINASEAQAQIARGGFSMTPLVQETPTNEEETQVEGETPEEVETQEENNTNEEEEQA